jgi:hypothetical protein
LWSAVALLALSMLVNCSLPWMLYWRAYWTQKSHNWRSLREQQTGQCGFRITLRENELKLKM